MLGAVTCNCTKTLLRSPISFIIFLVGREDERPFMLIGRMMRQGGKEGVMGGVGMRGRETNIRITGTERGKRSE